MTPERWRQVSEIFHAALAREGSARRRYLDDACAHDADLRGEVDAMLAGHADHSQFAEQAVTASSLEDPRLAAGTMLGTYRVERLIGAGGMGEVYLAEDARLQRKVAIKLLPLHFTQHADRVRRFKQEARAASALNHPNIVTIYDIGESEAGPFITMEFVAGRTLRSLGRTPVPIETLVDWSRQIAGALAVAHDAGIVHRDIKPDNIMIRDDGYVKVLDFGLARLASKEELISDLATAADTHPGALVGTLRYMAPEQAAGGKVSAAADLFALGVVLYELATGRHPLNADTLLGLMQALATGSPIPPSKIVPSLPAAFDALVLRLMDRDERRRPSARETVAALSSVKAGRVDEVAPTPSRIATHAMVGRDRQRNEMLAALRRIASGRGELLSISGEPGAGKTTLVEDFLAVVQVGEVRYGVGRGRCSERLAGTEAYLPVLEALDSLVRSDIGSLVAQQMMAIAPAWYSQISSAISGVGRPASEPQATSQERLKREITALLRELSRSQPLMLFFDDVHWADSSTIDLLGYVSARFDELRTLIVVTSRPSDLLLTNHPFLVLRRELQARRVCHEIVLDMLTLADVERYLSLEFRDHRFPAALAHLVHAKTEGSPLFMADVIRYLANKGTIAQDSNGRWALLGSLDAIGAELPESVRAMIDRKIAQLGEDDRVLLTAASVQGYEFDSAVVAQVLSRDQAEVEERMEILERVHRFVVLVDERELPDGTLTARYRFVHVLYQNALYGQLRATRRVALSAAVAETLTRIHGGRDAEIATELAALYEAARNNLRAAHYCRIATQHAAQLFASREVLVLARRGLALLEGLPPTPERQETELGLLISLGNAFIAVRGYSSDEVLETYTRALAVCEQLGETEDRAAVLYGFTAFHLVSGRHPKALSRARELLAFTERLQHPAVIAAHRLVGWALLAMGRPEAALPHFELCRTIYTPSRHRVLAYSFGQEPGMAARILLAVTLQLLGRVDDAKRACDEALDLARQTTHANSRCYVLHFASMYAQLAGDRGLTRLLAEEALRIADEQGLAPWTGWCRIMRGWAVADAGDLEVGVTEMRQGIDAARALGHELCHSYYLSLLAEMLMRSRRYDEAISTLEETDRLVNVNEERFCTARMARLRAQIVA
jgi:serine/threonine protein kinase/predicted ATPase